MKIFAYGLSALLVIVISAEATNRFYGDLKANSPNGRFHAEAKSLANRRGNWKTPFQRDFTVTFTDTRTRQAMWSWKQRKDDASPSELIPTDDGYLIMLDAWDAYCVFDTKGVRTDVLDVLNSLPEQEKKAFTDWTTAGVRWRQYSQQGFLTHAGNTYFYIRLYWGRTYIIDFARRVCATDPAVARRVEESVVAKTTELVKSFNGEYYAKCEDCGGKHLRSDLTDAVFVIKRHDMTDGQKLLNDIVKRSNDSRNSDLERYLGRVQTEKNPQQEAEPYR